MRSPTLFAVLLLTLLVPRASIAQQMILSDPLRGGTSGTAHGGRFDADGWHVTGADNYVYWHLPTTPHGAVEFSLRGIQPRESRPENDDKTELFHMYDWTFQNADTNYTGYRNNPFKHYVRKTGVLDTRPNRTDSLELVWVIGGNVQEPDSGVLSWDPAVTYRFREEWGPDGGGNAVIKTFRDGVLAQTMSAPGEWTPAGHAIRIGVARFMPDSGAPLDGVYSDLVVFDLSASPPPMIDPAPPGALPRGPVRVVGSSLVDDNGAFLGLGATYMTALWQAKNDRAQLASDLTLLASNGFNYIRALGQVGGGFWAGLEIAPVDLLNDDRSVFPAWPDYGPALQTLLDETWAHGMRTQITIFGGANVISGGAPARQAAVDAVLGAIAGREEKVILIEVANEGWNTGFPDAMGLAEMRDLAASIGARTQIPVAITSNHGANSIVETYAGSAADIATWHTNRDLGVDDGWGPVYAPWDLRAPGVPPVSSNEPIGPGSSVASQTSPIRLVMAAAFAWTAKLPMYVFHSNAGVRHLVSFESLPGLTEHRALRTLLPGDLASWQRNDGVEASAPFTAAGCVRNTGARKGDRFVSIPIGIAPSGLALEARQAIAFQVYDPLSGMKLDDRSLAQGERITLPQGPGAYILSNLVVESSTTGLTGEYFDAIDLTQPVLSRLDPRIDFDWGNGSPSPNIGADTFSVRWSGSIKAKKSEETTFFTVSDDGVRLWVDGRLLIDDWTDHGPIERSGTIALVAGRPTAIVLEYYENLGGAAVQLGWSSPTLPREIVPSAVLDPARPPEMPDGGPLPIATDGGAPSGAVDGGAQPALDSGSMQAMPEGEPLAASDPAAVKRSCGCRSSSGDAGSRSMIMLLVVALAARRRARRS